MSSNVGVPGNTSSMLGRVLNASQMQTSDGQPGEFAMGRHQQLYADEVHGAFFAATSRGRSFSAMANGVTGRTILAAAGTTSGFMFYNPAGTGVNMEITSILTLPLTATDVVGALALEYGAPPTTVTNAVTPVSTMVGGTSQTALCKASYGSTIVAMTALMWLPVFIQTTAGVLQGSSGLFLPNGSLIIAPGGAVNIISTTSQSTNLWAQGVTWTETPI